MIQRQEIVPKGFEFYRDRFHFAPAVRVGDSLYCSGQLGWAGPGRTVPADPKEQFTLAFENLGRVLEAADASFENVVELTSFHVGMEHLGVFSAVKDGYLHAPYPAWTAIGVSELAVPGALVEIRAIARV